MRVYIGTVKSRSNEHAYKEVNVKSLQEIPFILYIGYKENCL